MSKINDAAMSLVEELAKYWLEGTIEAGRFEADEYYAAPHYDSDLLDFINEDTGLLHQEPHEVHGGTKPFDIIQGHIIAQVIERAQQEMSWWEAWQDELDEMRDTGWKFWVRHTQSGMSLFVLDPKNAAIDPSAVLCIKNFDEIGFSEVYDDYYLPSLDEQEDSDDE